MLSNKHIDTWVQNPDTCAYWIMNECRHYVWNNKMTDSAKVANPGGKQYLSVTVFVVIRGRRLCSDVVEACCLFPTPMLPVLATNVCSHGDRLFHLVNMMWHVSSCTSQEMTGDWFILLPTQAMNDDTVKKLRSQDPKGQFSNCHVLYLKLKKFSLWNSVAALSGMLMSTYFCQ